jgi:hypothetical protein
MAQFRTDKNILDSGQVLTRYEVHGLMENITPSGAMLDAYGKFRVSQQINLFTSQRVGARQYKFDTSNTGNSSSTFSVNESSMLLTVGTSANDSVVRESYNVVPFQPGKSMMVILSYSMDPKMNVTQRVGYFDANNGVFLENKDGINYFVVRSSATGVLNEVRVAQSEWNVDKFDGTGYSSQVSQLDDHTHAIDVSKVNIVWMDMASFSASNIRFGFVINGKPYVAHILCNDGDFDQVRMTTISLPLRYEIKNTGTTVSSSTMRQVNCVVLSEGGFELTGLNDGVSRGYTIALADTLAVAGTEYPLISYRLKANRRNNVVIPNFFHIYVDSNATVSYRIWVNATAIGGTWETNHPDRHIEYNRSLTGFNTIGGRVVQGGFVSGGGGPVASNANLNNLNYTLGRYLNGGMQEVILAIIPTQANIKVLTKCDWIELI